MHVAPQTQHWDQVASLRLSDLSPGEILLIRTQDSRYTIVYLGFGAARISGTPEFSRLQETANILGSSQDGKSLEVGLIGQGMRLEVQLADHRDIIMTSPIEAIWRIGRA